MTTMNGNHIPTTNGNHVPGPLEATIVDQFDGWATKTPGNVAAEWRGEQLTYAELRTASLRVSRALLAAGVRPYDKVALLTDMSLEMLPSVLGILRTGAAYVPIDVAAWSRSRIEATLFELSSPFALVTTPVPGLELPVATVNFQKQWLRSPLGKAGELIAQLDALRSEFKDDLLSWIIFTSGTTGKPKGVMVYHRAIHALTIAFNHSDYLEASLGKHIRVMLAFSVAFDACAAVVWGALTKGRAVVMASSSSFPDVATTCEVLNLTPSMLASLDPSGSYDPVACIFLGAEAPNVEVVREWVNPARKVFNTYGPTETTCVISLGEIDPNEEPPFGDIVAGAKVVLVNDKLEECNHGEVLIGGPNLAAGYFNNPELTAAKFIQWNGERWYRTGDLAHKLENGDFVWAGRTDSLVKNRGFLINLETEVGPALLSFPAVRVAVALMWRQKLVGCVQPASVDIVELRAFLKERYDPFVVPDDILALDSFPLTVNSKIDKRALLAQLDERISEDDEGLSEEGKEISGYDALRLAFSKTLHVAIKELNNESSFTRLGGNSLTAIRLANFLKKHGYTILAIQILRLDTIGLLEQTLKGLPKSGESDYTSGPAVATDVQKLFLRKSLQSPDFCALIGTARYVGDTLAVPTASELHGAFIKAFSAHTVFQTRFSATDYALSDLGRLNLSWNEVSVEEAGFEAAIVAEEEKAFVAMKDVSLVDVEVPYFDVTAISVPGRKDIAFITRAHHILGDVFSTAILFSDVERALAGEDVPKGTRWDDFARFMEKYRQENLPRAISTFEKMLKPLPSTAVLQLPKPKTPPQEQNYDLMILDSPCAFTKSALYASARAQGITATTLVYAAWALFLGKITAWDQVGFSISLSGRTVPWPPAQSVVGPVVGKSPFSTAVPAQSTVHEWLAQVHKTTLDVMEFDGVTSSLPESMLGSPCTNSTNVLCFLDMPQASTSWTFKDKQKHNYLMDWYLFPHGDGLKTEFEFNFAKIDVDWAKDAAKIPGLMLEKLINATKETLVGDLLK
ncbi:putative nonribosomal peptide synthase [Pleomassaria siparia CBS 279.74]|uniref:Putative nonribosomal peptide synthase n=1 Tax=Pleomassaria siparia CBS 279.74 TaxID=1314801 RepID=A0A6G1KKD9_9PLEO|nr:putative nonribosomal peptide synthase [Pleomassaria siparia CBS 279.74]